MKPVSVSVDYSPSMDGLAIEACFEKSILSDNGKMDETSESPSFRMEPAVPEERDMDEDDYRFEAESSERAPVEESQIEESRQQEIDETPRELPSRSISRSKSDDNFVEAAFEMVLDYGNLSNKHEKSVTEENQIDEKGDANEPVQEAEKPEEQPAQEVEKLDTPAQASKELDEQAQEVEKLEEPREEGVKLIEELQDPEKVVVWSSDEGVPKAPQSSESDQSSESEVASPQHTFSDDMDQNSTHSEVTVTTNSTEAMSLSALIENRDWNQILDRLEQIESTPTVSVWTEGLDALGDSLLLEICKKQPPLQVVELWLESFPKDAERQCLEGRLPLHYACAHGASAYVIEALVNIFPGSLKEYDVQDKMLPLHYACKHAAEVNVIDCLLAAYPEATLVQDIHGQTPMDYAMNLEERSVRDRTVVCIQKGLKQNLSSLSELLAKSHTMISKEQEKVKELQRKIGLNDESGSNLNELQSLLNQTLERVATLEKGEAEKKAEIATLKSKLEDTETHLEETQLLLSAEKSSAVTEKTSDLEEALKLEKYKMNALEQSLVAKQQLLAEEREKAKNFKEKLSELEIELEQQRAKTKELEDALALETTTKGEHAKVDSPVPKAPIRSLLMKEDVTTKENKVDIEDEIESEFLRRAELEEIRLENKVLLTQTDEMVLSLAHANEKKQEMLEEQQQKVEALERVHREKEALLQQNQETMKNLEQSISLKLALQKSEEEKIRQLENLRVRKREMIEAEEEQVRKLDYTLGRKQALLELEQMKEKTLKQTIERKNALMEAEQCKVEELKKTRAEEEALLAAENDMADALASSNKEKERQLRAERKLVEELHAVLAEKAELLEQKAAMDEDLEAKVKVAEAMVAKEKELWESAKQIKEDSEAMLREADESVKTVDLRSSEKALMLSKETIITESLEKFKRRRHSLVSSGRLYTFVDTTLSVSLLVKEALLAKRHEKALLEDKNSATTTVPSSTGGVVKAHTKQNVPSAKDVVKKAMSPNGRLFFNQFAGFFGLSNVVGARKRISK